MRVSLKNNQGFSLVELMVVVAIIGILAAVAVPNFQRFTAKSKRSEAVSNLSALYTAERAYKAEWNQYHTAFQAVGYAPTGTMRYQHGFATAYTTAPTGFTNPGTMQSSTQQFCAQGGTVPANGCLVITVPRDPTAVGASTAAIDTFTAAAKGDIDGDVTFDEITITQDKTIAQVTDDLNL